MNIPRFRFIFHDLICKQKFSTRLVQKLKWWRQMRKKEFILKTKFMRERAPWGLRNLLLTYFRHFSGQVEQIEYKHFNISMSLSFLYYMRRRKKNISFCRESSSPCCSSGWLSCLCNNRNPILHGAYLRLSLWYMF